MSRLKRGSISAIRKGCRAMHQCREIAHCSPSIFSSILGLDLSSDGSFRGISLETTHLSE